MNKVLKTISLTVIFLFILSVFGWMVFHISKGDKDFGFLTEPVKSMYTFPDLFSQSVEEVKTLPKTFVKTPENFKPVNKLDSDLNVLITYSDTGDSRTIELLNLKNDSSIYKWAINNPHKEQTRIFNPLLFPKKSLVYSFDGKGIRKIDSLANIIWKLDTIWGHHAMNLDSSGNIWACTFPPVYFATGMYKMDGKSVFYKDNYITKIDAESGKPLFHKSISKILIENDLPQYIFKSTNIRDPLHLNDVEPVLKTTKYFKEGDLFISLKYPSIVLHYRPSTNKILDIIEGPFISQHDVDILNDSSIVLFNNSYYINSSLQRKKAPKDSIRLVFAGDFYSNIMQYNIGSQNINIIGDSVFKANRIYSYTEGLQEFIDPSTYFVEEQNTGVLWVIRNDNVVYKNVIKSQHEGYHHLTNWTRIIKNYE